MNTALNAKISMETLAAAYENNGFVMFQNDARDYNLNIFGIRSMLLDTDTFNDIIGLAWKYQGAWNIKTYAATTDPGLYYFANPMTSKGTHIMKKGQYRKAYVIGRHKDRYGALQQIGPIDFYEDNDRDKQFDRTKIVYGQYFGANIHATINKVIPDLLTAPLSDFPDVESSTVHTWSAACQVHANPRKYLEFMKYIYASGQIYGDKFTYALFEESEDF